MDEFEKVRDDLLKKQLGPDYKKFDMPRKNMPTENDMGPLPKKEPAKKFSKGGTASARADGCAVKGKTKGRII